MEKIRESIKQKLRRQHRGHRNARRQGKRGDPQRPVGRNELPLIAARLVRTTSTSMPTTPMSEPHDAEDDLHVERKVEDVGEVEGPKHGVADPAAGQHHFSADDPRQAGQQVKSVARSMIRWISCIRAWASSTSMGHLRSLALYHKVVYRNERQLSRVFSGIVQNPHETPNRRQVSGGGASKKSLAGRRMRNYEPRACRAMPGGNGRGCRTSGRR